MDDITITCVECGTPFVWTAGDQSFYAERQLTAPKRCRPCRDARKKRLDHKSPYSLPGYRKR